MPKQKKKTSLLSNTLIRPAVRFRKYILAAYLLVVFLFLTLPLPAGEGGGSSWIAPVGHFTLFFGLYGIAEFAHLFKTDTKLLLNCLALAVLFEILQLALPYRAFDFFDMATNIFGVSLSFAAVSLTKGHGVYSYIRSHA
jgi:glycopeptide antibiotics resistance protein